MTTHGQQHVSLVRARVRDSLIHLRLDFVAERIDGFLAEAAKRDKSFLELVEQRKRVTTGISIALEDFELEF